MTERAAGDGESRLEALLSSVHERFDRIDQHLGEQDSRAASFEAVMVAELRSLHADLGVVRARLDDLGSRIDRLERRPNGSRGKAS